MTVVDVASSLEANHRCRSYSEERRGVQCLLLGGCGRKRASVRATREGRGWATRCAARGGGWTQIGSRSDKATGILRNSKIGAAIAQSGNCRGRVVLRDVE